MLRHINPVKVHRERITKKDKKLVDDLDYDGIEFPVRQKDFSKIKTKNNICVNVFVIKISWFFQFTFQIKNLKTRRICCL